MFEKEEMNSTMAPTHSNENCSVGVRMDLSRTDYCITRWCFEYLNMSCAVVNTVRKNKTCFQDCCIVFQSLEEVWGKKTFLDLRASRDECRYCVHAVWPLYAKVITQQTKSTLTMSKPNTVGPLLGAKNDLM